MKILLDTSVLIALNVESDSNHVRVEKYIDKQIGLGSSFHVTDYVLDEYFTRMLYDYGAKIASKCVVGVEKQINNKSLNLVPVAIDLFEYSKKLFLKSVNKKLSFTDSATFVVYDRYNMDEICTLDSDFRKVGARISIFAQ